VSNSHSDQNRLYAYCTSNRAVLNGTHSPFLKFSAEIRARIYGYVLDRKVIHICKPLELGDGPVVCAHPTSYEVGSRFSNPSERVEGVCPKGLGCDESHQDCYENPLQLQQFSLGLLSVRGQIYHEAILVPFTDNEFVDDTRIDLDGLNLSPRLPVLLDRLVPIQARSIRHLVLQTTFMSAYCVSHLNRVPGLRTLEFHLLPPKWAFATAQGFIEFYEDDFDGLHFDRLRLPDLAHVRISVLECEHRIPTVVQEVKKIEE
jgi:hypothetical protein